jgi:hypothetical protein
MAPRQLGQTVGIVEEAPLGLQHVDRLAVALDMLLQPGELGLQRLNAVLGVEQPDPRRHGDGEGE